MKKVRYAETQSKDAPDNSSKIASMLTQLKNKQLNLERSLNELK